MYELAPGCRSCGEEERESVLSLGTLPLADGLLCRERLGKAEPRFPLTLAFCRKCSLVQILENVDPGTLFGEDYPYFSSFSDGWLRHCRENALEIIGEHRLDSSSLVFEPACNDGYMLGVFLEQGIPVLGADPAPGPATVAEARGIPVLREFFTEELALRLRAEGRRADVVIANNVLAHVPDLPGFVRGMAAMLTETGVAVVEVPWIRALVDHCQFDTIYHEHHCYFSVTALVTLFEREGLFLNDVRSLPTHGGSLRLYAGKTRRPSPAVARFLGEEHEHGVDGFEYYRDFACRVEVVRSKLRQLLQDLRAGDKRVVAYGAAAKGATLLNASGIDGALVEYVVDRNPYKQGKYMPGVHLPVRDPARLLLDQPDYVLLLAWNLLGEVLVQQSEFVRRGGKFIVPIPEPRVLP